MTNARQVLSVLVAFLLVMQTVAIYAAEPQSRPSQTSSLTGRVIAKGDSGIDGVKVTCAAPKDAVCRPLVVSTDKDGNFTFPEVTPSEKYRLTFEHARYLHITESGSPGEPMTVQMEPYLIKGQVFDDSTGIKVPQASVTCVKKEGPPQAECNATTDNDGRFSIQPLQDIIDPSITYDLVITHGRFPNFKYPGVKPSDPPKDLEVHLPEPAIGKTYPVDTISGHLIFVSVVNTDPHGLIVKDEASAIRAYPVVRTGRSLPYDQIRTIGPEVPLVHSGRRRRAAYYAIAAGVALTVGVLAGRHSVKSSTAP